jgi:hypothetical protein
MLKDKRQKFETQGFQPSGEAGVEKTGNSDEK